MSFHFYHCLRCLLTTGTFDYSELADIETFDFADFEQLRALLFLFQVLVFVSNSSILNFWSFSAFSLKQIKVSDPDVFFFSFCDSSGSLLRFFVSTGLDSLKPTLDLSMPILDTIGVHSKSFEKLYETFFSVYLVYPLKSFDPYLRLVFL